MVDLETLGTMPGCSIVSIGACKFGPEGITETFYEIVDITTSKLRIDPDTLKWWVKQSDQARTIFNSTKAISLATALKQFERFWVDNGGKYFWCHGATFDAPILTAAFHSFNAKPPFQYWEVRDTRTLYHLAETEVPRDKSTYHNALADAVAQATVACTIFNEIGWPK